MAKLLNTQSNALIILRSQHIFGRHSGSSNTLLDNPEASRLHASILWEGSFWLLQDTSSNGIFVNDKKMNSGVKRKLKLGDRIRFGALNACEWIFNNDTPPKSLLVPIEPESQSAPIELEGVVVLPNDTSYEITLYQTPNKDWIYENHTGSIRLEQGTKILTKDNSWYFVSADTFASTKHVDSIHNKTNPNIKAYFTVSRNEEHVSLSIVIDGKQIDLGERIHHYLLLFLSRNRLTDQQSGIEDSEQGWIDKDLLTQLTGLDENHINIQIYRFRKQLINAVPSAMQLLQIIERRRGQLRIALNSVEINGKKDILKM